MVLEETVIGAVLAVALAVVLIYFAIRLGKKAAILLVNSFLGLVALVLLNFFPFMGIDINIFSVLIVALGGIPGIILLWLLSTLGIAF